MDIIIREDKKDLTERQKKKKKNQIALLNLYEAETYLTKSLKAYRLIGLGVWSVLTGVASLIALGGVGLFTMFVGIGFGVMMFILSATGGSEFEQIEGMPIRLDAETYDIIEQKKYAMQSRNQLKLSLGVALILLAVGAVAGLGLSPAILLFTIGFSVFMIINSATSMGTFDHLLSQGDYLQYSSYHLLESTDQALEQKTLVRQIRVNSDPVMENVLSTHEDLLEDETSTSSGNVSSQKEGPSPPSNNDLELIKSSGNTFISQLYVAKNLITNPTTLMNVDEIIDLTNKIIYRLEKEPGLIPSTMRLFDYYLPTTVKLVENYGEVKKQGISGTNIDSMIRSIEEALSNLTIAYKSQLEKLYLHTSVDLEAEIAALETMLKKEGLLSDGMNDLSNINNT